MNSTTKQEEMSLFRIRATRAWVAGGVVITVSYGVAYLSTFLRSEAYFYSLPIGLSPLLFPIHLVAVLLTREASVGTKWRIYALVMNIIGALVSLALSAYFIWARWILESD